jgi:hypothetical protein
MSDFAAIGIILLAMLGIGAMLYFPMRWLALRSAPPNHKSRRVTRKELLLIGSTVAGMLILYALAQWGNKAAAVAFVVIMLSAHIVAFVTLQRAKDKETES